MTPRGWPGHGRPGILRIVLAFAASARTLAQDQCRTLGGPASNASGPPIVVGAVLGTRFDQPYSFCDRRILLTLEMFFSWLQVNRSGVNVRGTLRQIQVVTCEGDGSVNATLGSIRHAFYDLGADFFIASCSPAITETAAQEIEQYWARAPRGGRAPLLFMPVQQTPALYSSRPFIFQLPAPFANMLNASLAELRRFARTISYVMTDEPLAVGICRTVPVHAERNDMIVRSTHSISAAANDSSTFSYIALQLQKTAPDIVVTCMRGSQCVAFLDALKQGKVSPPMVIFTMCHMGDHLDELEDEARWVLSLTAWHPQPGLQSDFSGWTAMDFRDKFLELTMEEPRAEEAATWAAAEVLLEAIEGSGSTSPSVIAPVLLGNTYHTLFGEVQLDAQGENKQPYRAVQIQAADEELLVIPAVSRMVFPIPPWADRLCTQSGTSRYDTVTNISVYGYNGTNGTGVCGNCYSLEFNTYAVFDPTTQRRVCLACPAGRSARLSNSIVVTDTAAVCAGCAPGQRAVGDQCEDCPAGTESSSTVGECDDCSKGKYRTGTGSPICQPCAVGHFAESTRSSSCTACEKGKAQIATGRSACTDCLVGFYADGEGRSECTFCPVGQVANSTPRLRTVCYPCDPGSFALADSSACVTCSVGRYQGDVGQSECIADSDGLNTALPGQAKPQNQPGFWYNDDSQLAERCATPHACLDNFGCAVGCTGRQCYTCLPPTPDSAGYFRTTDGCLRCPPFAINALIFFAHAVILGLLYLGVAQLLAASAADERIIYPVLLKQMLTHWCTMTVLSRVFKEVTAAASAASPELQQTFQAVSTFMEFDGIIPTDSQVFSISCLAQVAFTDAAQAHDTVAVKAAQATEALRFLFIWACQPFLMILVGYLVGFIRLQRSLRGRPAFYRRAVHLYYEVYAKGYRKARNQGNYIESDFRELVNAYFVRVNRLWWPMNHVRAHVLHFRRFMWESEPLLLLGLRITWMRVGRELLSVARCTRLVGAAVGANVHELYGSLQCAERVDVYILSVAAGTVWMLFFPVLIVVKLAFTRDRLHRGEVRAQMSLFVNGYRSDCYWWDVVVFIRLAAMVGVDFFLHGKLAKLLAYLLVILIALVLQFAVEPYDLRRANLLNWAEARQLLVATVSCIGLAAVLYFDGQADALLSMMLLALVLHILYVVCMVLLVLHSLLQSAAPKINIEKVTNMPNGLRKRLWESVISWHTWDYKHQPYCAFDHSYGWVSICGSGGHEAVPPYIPRGRDAIVFEDGRPALSHAPAVPAQMEVEEADISCRLTFHKYVVAAVMTVVRRMSGNQMFSASVMEFVLRAAFVFARQERENQAAYGPGANEPEVMPPGSHATMEAHRYHDPLCLLQVPKKEDQATGAGSPRPQAAQRQGQGKGGMGFNFEEESRIMWKAARLEEDLRKNSYHILTAKDPLAKRLLLRWLGRGRQNQKSSRSLQKAGGKAHKAHKMDKSPTHGAAKAQTATAPVPAGADGGADGAAEGKEEEPEEDLQVLLERLEHERFDELVSVMFAPMTYRKGIAFDDLQLALSRLAMMPPEDLTVWMDIFEKRWRVERVAGARDLKRQVGGFAEVGVPGPEDGEEDTFAVPDERVPEQPLMVQDHRDQEVSTSAVRWFSMMVRLTANRSACGGGVKIIRPGDVKAAQAAHFERLGWQRNVLENALDKQRREPEHDQGPLRHRVAVEEALKRLQEDEDAHGPSKRGRARPSL